MRFQQQTTPNTPSTSSWYSNGFGTVPAASHSVAPPEFAWPDAVAYREAIQSPRTALGEPWLRDAHVSMDRRGLPIAYTGRFAVVFRLATGAGEQWALRCFTSTQEGGDRISRYAAIQKALTEHEETLASYFVPFLYLPQGVKVGSHWYPALAMRWAVGKPLGRWVEERRADSEALRRICGALSGLIERLDAAEIAHGDWQHDNLLISEDGRGVTLVDYDGMYVPELAGHPAAESGHPNYQHPGRTPLHYGPGLDRFSCLVIQTALLGLSHDPTLWERFSDGESLLFKKVDFTNPSASPLFHTLRALAELYQDDVLADSVARLQDACQADVASVLPPAIEAAAPPEAQSYVSEMPPVVAPAPVRNSSIFGRGGKWWLTPEVTSQPVAAGTGVSLNHASATILSRGFSPVATPQAQQIDYVFLARLQEAATIQAEQNHLWGWRAGAAGFFALICLLIYAWIQSRSGFFPFYFFWLINFANLGYSRWPRKRIYEELVGEIAKMENLIGERQRRIAEKSIHTLTPLSGTTVVAANATVSDFVADKLRQTSINRVLTVPGINVSTLRQLRAEGIETALDLQRRTNIAHVPPHQVTALQTWCRELEAQAADEFRKTTSSSGAVSGRSVPVDVARLQHEMAEFERHVEHLKRERDFFPDTSAGAYFRKLLGMPEANQSSTPAP